MRKILWNGCVQASAQAWYKLPDFSTYPQAPTEIVENPQNLYESFAHILYPLMHLKFSISYLLKNLIHIIPRPYNNYNLIKNI